MIVWLFALELGLLSGGVMVGEEYYVWPDQSTYIIMEVEAQWGPVFAGGEIENIQYALHAASYDPVHADYRFNAGLRWREFEIGWKHECRHPVVGRTDGSGIRGGYDKFYVRAELRR